MNYFSVLTTYSAPETCWLIIKITAILFLGGTVSANNWLWILFLRDFPLVVLVNLRQGLPVQNASAIRLIIKANFSCPSIIVETLAIHGLLKGLDEKTILTILHDTVTL